MTTQPTALQMADHLESRGLLEEAAELRRLHAKCEALTEDTIEEMHRITEIHRLTAQRDALLAALKELTGHTNKRFTGGVWDRARAAIKAVEEETK